MFLKTLIHSFRAPPTPPLAMQIITDPFVRAFSAWGLGVATIQTSLQVAKFVRETPQEVVTQVVEELPSLAVIVETPPPPASYFSMGREVMVNAYKVVKGNKEALGALALLAGTTYLGYRYFFGRKRNIIVKPRLFESVVSGSNEIEQEMAGCQVAVAIGSPNQIELIGSGIRVDVLNRSFVLTAAHNVSKSDATFYISKGGDMAVLKGKKFSLAADAVAIEVDSGVLSRMSVAKAKLGSQCNKAFVSVTGISGKGTTGQLKLITGVFGRVEYTGTTMAGYSGAPYCSGTQVYGMHTNGGTTNEGYLLTYLYQVLKIELGVQEEGDYSFAWYKQFMSKRGDKREIDHGEYVILMNDDGYCYSVPKNTYKEYAEKLARDQAWDAGKAQYDEQYRDLESKVFESLNSQSPGASRAGDSSVPTPALVPEVATKEEILALLRHYQWRWQNVPLDVRQSIKQLIGTSPPSQTR